MTHGILMQDIYFNKSLRFWCASCKGKLERKNTVTALRTNSSNYKAQLPAH